MRTRQSPGIETHEIDRSQYGNQDNSIVNTTSFIMGFTDKGMNYETLDINSINAFVTNYGYPTNEAERYFYNAACEVFFNGGVLRTTRLPYDNESLNKVAFTTYNVVSGLNVLSSTVDVIESLSTDNADYPRSLYEFILCPYKAEMELSGTLDEYGVRLDTVGRFVKYVFDNIDLNYNYREIFTKLITDEDGNLLNKSVQMTEDLANSLTSQTTYAEFLEKYGKTEDDLGEEVFELIRTSLDEMIKRTHPEEYVQGSEFDLLLEDVRNGGGVTLYDVRNDYEKLREYFSTYLSVYDTSKIDSRYTEIKDADSNVTSYVELKSNDNSISSCGLMTLREWDDLKINQGYIPKNQIRIIDTTMQQYEKDGKTEYLGICPVIVSPANAMYAQTIIKANSQNFRDYNLIDTLQNVYVNQTEEEDLIVTGLNNNTYDTLENKEKFSGFVTDLGTEAANENSYTVSKELANYFPALTYRNTHLNTENLKKIGIVVLKAYRDTSCENKISFQILESFNGSLDRDAKNDNGQSIFIDDVVNENSRFINVFSNVPYSKNDDIYKASTLFIKDQAITTLGYYEKQCDKTISLKTSVLDAIDKILERNEDLNTSRIDLVVDAGVSTIGQFVASMYGKDGKGYFDPTKSGQQAFKLRDYSSVQDWYAITKRYDDFCKNVRKDCMFIADAPRNLVLDGNYKMVRNTNIGNTVENTIIPNLRYVSGLLNTSYGAGYSDWFRSIDQYTGQYFWCPPSIKAMGVYIYTDAYANYWDAPAGMNRGRIDNTVDVSFSPKDDLEAGKFYNNNWNYAISYPLEGIILEGQKTFQKNKTAFDRVNVRRLFLGLEKRVRNIAKYFVYEGITDWMMERFVDSIDPVLKDAQDKGGIKEYVIICDERNNNDTTIENNELHCTIAIKPVKTLEFLVLNFVCTSQGADVEEVANEVL